MEQPSTPAAPLLALTFWYASHTSRLEISNDFPDSFNSVTRLLPENSGWPNNQATDDPAPSLRSHYRSFSTTTSRSADMPRNGTQSLAVSAA